MTRISYPTPNDLPIAARSALDSFQVRLNGFALCAHAPSLLPGLMGMSLAVLGARELTRDTTLPHSATRVAEQGEPVTPAAGTAPEPDQYVRVHVEEEQCPSALR
ncbi:hypothetical protein ABT160_35445 [Streptomyces sp. NPDC001941]|uniref:hypothetical protein n=1 Tax=Streptomyces sp. NPDC001941 TaxID=3154659 RepID=UPI0033200E49